MESLRISLGNLLDEVATKHPGNEAMVDLLRRKRYSYEQFRSLTNQLAKGFFKLGLKRGERLALWSPNRPEWIITQFALAKIGVVLVSVDTNAQPQQLEYILKQSDSRSLIMAEGIKGSEYIDMIHRLCPEVSDSIPGQLNSPNLPELKNLILISERPSPGMFTWNEILEWGPMFPIPCCPKDSAPPEKTT